jgi:uncharacterized protein YecE (DUF72 family)
MTHPLHPLEGKSMDRAFIGTSGYVYRHWRGSFYPEGLAQRHWLRYVAERFNSIELNGTFYSLKSPSVFEKWLSEVPESGFVFAIKGSRYITHNLKLRNLETAMGNFLASGVLALGLRTGPLLWQLPATYHFEAQRIAAFLEGLPRTTGEAARLAERHDHRLKRGALTEAAEDLPLRHALEVRHESYACDEFLDLLRQHNCANVLADTAGRFLRSDDVTADFVYVRLHGSHQLYVSQYCDDELDHWADRIGGWVREGKDVYVYFDNDAHAHAPQDALRLSQRMQSRS